MYNRWNVGTPEGGNQGNPSNKWNLGAGRSKILPYETFFSKKQYLVWKNKSRHFQTENTKSTPEAFDLLFVAPSAGYTNGKEQQNE